MKGYGQFCPVAKAAEVLGDRWTLLVVRELLCGSRHFNDLRRGVPLMSPSLLSQRLKQLERAGIIEREPDRRSKQGMAYQLTAAGHELTPVVMMLGNWGQRWARSELKREDLDPALLMWDMHRRLNTENLPAQRTVLQFEFRDVNTAKRFWWLVIKRDEVDVCMKRPGYEVDMTITTRVKTLAAVWIGNMSLRDAIKQGLIELQGPDQLTRQLDSWLALSTFAKIQSATATTPVRAAE
jgi:DNA-binding HxlR family transcriptional regulator